VRRARAASRGITLIEILIAMTVSMVVMLAVYQTLAASEGYRRAATGGGDATFNGSIALFTLQHDARMAGFGLNTTALLGCRVLSYDGGVDPVREFTFTLAPVTITQGAGTAPDSIEFSYSSTDNVPAPIRLTQAMPSATSDLHIENAFGIISGHLMIVAEGGQDCTLMQATNTPSLESAGLQDLLKHGSGTYRSPIGTTVASRYNKPGGMGPNYSLSGVVFPIGPAPSVNRYSVQNETLVVDQVLQATTALPVAASIVQFQAQYGKDNDNDGVIDVWDEVTPNTANGWAGVLAIRMALASRSAVAERPDADGVCQATTVAPDWAGGALDLSARADWRCFRYRVFESTVSLRNMIWRPV
jgi:type IV pilus assembly protein PilW